MSKLDITFDIWEQIKEKIDSIFQSSMICLDCLHSIPHDVCHYPTNTITYLTIGELFTEIIDIASNNSNSNSDNQTQWTTNVNNNTNESSTIYPT